METSINDVRGFLILFDPPTYHVRQFLTNNLQFFGVILDPLPTVHYDSPISEKKKCHGGEGMAYSLKIME